MTLVMSAAYAVEFLEPEPGNRFDVTKRQAEKFGEHSCQGPTWIGEMDKARLRCMPRVGAA